MVAVSNEYELNPLTKQIYAFPAKGGGVEPIVSIDGWLKIINSQPSFDGMEVVISPDGEEATCKIYHKDRAHPTVITEYKSECERKTEPWKTMPKRMLRHKAIMQCGRVAFGISGIYDEDEAKDISRNSEPRNVTPKASFKPLPSAKGNDSENKSNDFEISNADEIKDSEPQGKTKAKQEKRPEGAKGEAVITGVELLEGQTKGKAWSKFTVALQTKKALIHAVTFSTRIGGLAEFSQGQKCMAWISKDAKGNFKLEELEILTEEGGVE